jgi:Na+/melibiose symporter-like transporter
MFLERLLAADEGSGARYEVLSIVALSLGVNLATNAHRDWAIIVSAGLLCVSGILAFFVWRRLDRRYALVVERGHQDPKNIWLEIKKGLGEHLPRLAWAALVCLACALAGAALWMATSLN